MTRRNASTGDSLDLLLDTICNTFGGILFIAMLVAILSGNAGQTAQQQPVDPLEHQQMLAAQQKLKKSSQQLLVLQKAVQQARRLQQTSVTNETAELAQQLQSLHVSTADMVRQRNTGLNTMAVSQQQTNDAIAELQRTRTAIAEAKQSLAAAQRELQQERLLRTRTSRLPRQKTTTRLQVPFFLKAGRLCAFAQPDARGNIIRNTTETRVVTEGGTEYGEPIPGAGIMVPREQANSPQLTARIRSFDPDRHFIAIIVWPDSFAHFDNVRNTLVREGFEYQLVPMSRDERIPIGSTTTEQLVQ